MKKMNKKLMQHFFLNTLPVILPDPFHISNNIYEFDLENQFQFFNYNNVSKKMVKHPDDITIQVPYSVLAAG